MGGMDTEVTISRYSHLNFTEEQKRATPYMEVLSEAHLRDLGSRDIDLIMTNLLADKFNALPERAGKPDVRENVRALKRLQKEVIKTKEVLSANKEASIKVPELLDYVTLQMILKREEVEKACEALFERVLLPVDEALKKAGMTLE
jgi:molecular chaperone DnaK (HSP70)